LIGLSDARLAASVLPDRGFVQMPGVAQNKFKWSVAGTLHPERRKVPKWNKLTIPRRRRGRSTGHLPLTADNAAGFNPSKDRGNEGDGG